MSSGGMAHATQGLTCAPVFDALKVKSVSAMSRCQALPTLAVEGRIPTTRQRLPNSMAVYQLPWSLLWMA